MTTAITSVRRASRRAAANVRQDMKQGIDSLAAIATLAPFVGFFGTVVGIVTSFRGMNGSKEAASFFLMGDLSESLWPTAFGLLVGIAALWCHRYLSSNLRALDFDMELAGRTLIEQLDEASPLIRVSAPHDLRPMFGERPLAELQQEANHFRRFLRLSIFAILSAWSLQTAYFRYLDGFTWNRSAIWSTLIVLFLTTMSICPAYPIWIKILHRQRGGLLATSSVIGLCLTAILIASRL